MCINVSPTLNFVGLCRDRNTYVEYIPKWKRRHDAWKLKLKDSNVILISCVDLEVNRILLDINHSHHHIHICNNRWCSSLSETWTSAEVDDDFVNSCHVPRRSSQITIKVTYTLFELHSHNKKYLKNTRQKRIVL